MTANLGSVLITGAASGIGRATACLLAEFGASAICLLDQDEAGLEQTRQLIQPRCKTVFVRRVDVTDDVLLHQAFEDAYAATGGVNHVFNNAGMMSPFPVFPQTAAGDLDRTIAVNFRAVVLGTQYGFHLIQKSGGGSILNTSSGAAKFELPTDPVYAGTKAAINQFSLSCADAFRVQGVRINVICPGVVDTPILSANSHPVLRPETTQELMKKAGLSMLTAQDIASEAVRLFRDSSRNGEVVFIQNRKLAN